MNAQKVSRRRALGGAGALVAAAMSAEHSLLRAAPATQTVPSPALPFRYCLNTATIRGQKLGIVKEVEITAQAGYDGIEPWMSSLNDYVKAGGSLPDLRKRIADAGLTVEGAIGFAEWIVDDDARRSQGLERARGEMEMVAQIGGKRAAAPPAGATELPKMDLRKATERYLALLKIGDEIGVVPVLEVWGFSHNLGCLGDCVAVAMETGHPKACVLPDVFHLYKGGSDFRGIRLLGPAAIPVLHVNDYPAEPTREKIDDSFRLYPGDGTAPLTELLGMFRQTGGQKTLSLELFSRKYWSENPLEVAKAGLAKMKALTAKL